MVVRKPSKDVMRKHAICLLLWVMLVSCGDESLEPPISGPDPTPNWLVPEEELFDGIC